MLSSISPVGESARRQRWWLTVAAYVVGSIVGGALLGAVAGTIGVVVTGLAGTPATALRLLIFGAAAVLGAALDATRGVPTWHRQVDERWLDRYRGWVYGLGYGVQLGFGLVTIVPRSAMWALVTGLVLLGDVAAAVAAGTVFGAVRGAPILFGYRARQVDGLRRLLAAVERLRHPADRATTVAQFAVGATALGMLVV